MLDRLTRAAFDVFFISAMLMCLAFLVTGGGVVAGLLTWVAMLTLPLLLALLMVKMYRDENA